jgi:hypothetical protein
MSSISNDIAEMYFLLGLISQIILTFSLPDWVFKCYNMFYKKKKVHITWTEKYKIMN